MALPQIRCQLHDYAKQYDNYEVWHNKRNGGKLHGNISRNGYGNAIMRYIAMQFSTVPFIMTRFIIVILLLHDHVADIVFVAKPPS